MRLAITGATGLVGWFVLSEARSAGDTPVLLSRQAPPPGSFAHDLAHLRFDLDGPPPSLKGVDALVHLALMHAPGRYRGGEGDDPEAFRRCNVDGTLRLVEAARRDGVKRVIFLSSRAVYGGYPPGTRLTDDLPPRPDTLYGEAKAMVDAALASMNEPGFATASLRATGIYGPPGPGQRHKWASLFEGFLAGKAVAPRVATEVHGEDLAAAIRLLLRAPEERLGGRSFNLSDLLLDRRDLLAEVARIAGRGGPLPERSDGEKVSAMDCARLAALGWSPGGWPRLTESLPALLAGIGGPELAEPF